MLFFCFWSFVPGSLLFAQSDAVIVTDKPYYVAGESLRYAVFLDARNDPRMTEQIYYVELWSDRNSLIGRHILNAKEGYLHGMFELKEDLPASVGVLRVYSYDLTREPGLLPARSILIWDPDEAFEQDHPLFSQTPDAISTPDLKSLEIRTENESVLTRSPVDVTVSFPALHKDEGSFQFVVLARQARYFPASSSRQEFRFAGHQTEADQGVQYDVSMLSRERLLLRGHYDAGNNEDDQVFKLVAFSILGEDPVFEYEYTNRNGNFVFDISHVRGDLEKVYLTPVDGKAEGISLRKPSDIPLLRDPELNPTPEWAPAFQRYLQNARLRNRIYENYQSSDLDRKPVEYSIFDTTRIYEEADQTFRLSEYVEFRDMQEMIREILLYVKLHDRGQRLSIYNRTNPDLTDEPLFLVNGLPVRDHAFILDLDVRNIDVVEVLYSKRTLLPFGWLGRGGIMAIYTIEPVEVPGVRAFEIQGIHQPDEVLAYRYDEEEMGSPVPDFNPLVYWKTNNINTKGESFEYELDFHAIDETGPMQIIVYALGSDGNRYYAEKTIMVEMNMADR